MANSSKITIETADGEIVITQLSRNFAPTITLRKFDYVDTGKVAPSHYEDGEVNPYGGQTIKERQCVEETAHKLSSGAVKELVKALQYYV